MPCQDCVCRSYNGIHIRLCQIRLYYLFVKCIFKMPIRQSQVWRVQLRTSPLSFTRSEGLCVVLFCSAGANLFLNFWMGHGGIVSTLSTAAGDKKCLWDIGTMDLKPHTNTKNSLCSYFLSALLSVQRDVFLCILHTKIILSIRQRQVWAVQWWKFPP